MLRRGNKLEDELVSHYRLGKHVLGWSALGFVLSTLLLVYLVGRASVRHFAKSEEAARPALAGH